MQRNTSYKFFAIEISAGELFNLFEEEKTNQDNTQDNNQDTPLESNPPNSLENENETPKKDETPKNDETPRVESVRDISTLANEIMDVANMLSAARMIRNMSEIIREIVNDSDEKNSICDCPRCSGKRQEILNKMKDVEKYDDICSICLENMLDADENQKIIELPCKHMFHRECCEKHMMVCFEENKKVFCPMCRKTL